MRRPAEYDRAAAAFTAAFDRWRRIPGLRAATGMAPPADLPAKLIGQAQAATIEALMWARGFDEAACDREPGVPGLVGYQAHRPAFMDAAVYAANKGVHLLMAIAEVNSTSGPAGWGAGTWGGGTTYRMLTWFNEDALPEALDRPRDRKLRAAFVDHWCGQSVERTLADVQQVLGRARRRHLSTL